MMQPFASSSRVPAAAAPAAATIAALSGTAAGPAAAMRGKEKGFFAEKTLQSVKRYEKLVAAAACRPWCGRREPCRVQFLPPAHADPSPVNNGIRRHG